MTAVGVHHPCDDAVTGAEQTEAHHTEGDREDGEDHQQEVQRDPDAVEAVRMRGRDGAQVPVPRRQEERKEKL